MPITSRCHETYDAALPHQANPAREPTSHNMESTQVSRGSLLLFLFFRQAVQKFEILHQAEADVLPTSDCCHTV